MSKRNFESGKFSPLNPDILLGYEKGWSYTRISKSLTDNQDEVESLRKYIGQYIRHVFEDDADVLEQNYTLSKSAQRSRDLLRINRKSLRIDHRVMNVVEELNKQITSALADTPIKIKQHKFAKKTGVEGTLILQLSDIHAGVLVSLNGENFYDFSVMSKRLEKLAQEVISFGRFKKSNKLFVASLGDIMSSDRRLDEQMTMASNNAFNVVVATQLIASFLTSLSKHFTIEVGAVVGNESRTKKEIAWSKITATDNLDTTVYCMLEQLFKGHDELKFIGFEPNELVVEIEGKNFLFLHGHQLPIIPKQKDIQTLMGKYSVQGVQIFHVMFGHIHDPYLATLFSRNGSLISSDAYSSEALGFSSRASQNIHYVGKEGMMSTKIDLQEYEGYEGYDISNFDKYDLLQGVKHKKDKGSPLVIKKSFKK